MNVPLLPPLPQRILSECSECSEQFSVFQNCGQHRVCIHGSGDISETVPVMYQDRMVGSWIPPRTHDFSTPHVRYFADIIETLLIGNYNQNLRFFDWLESVKALDPTRIDWIGIYFKASWRLMESGTDLVLGPFMGEPTIHKRIPIHSGFCGLALREERTVVVDDVTADPRHLACSLKTRSEIVIPLSDGNGNLIAELDIDSNQPASFTNGLQDKILSLSNEFPTLLEEI